MVKKKSAKSTEKPAKKQPANRKLAVRVSDEDRKTRAGGKLLPIAIFMRDEDNARLDALCEEYCIQARTGAVRYAIKRWHRYVSRQAGRPGYAKPDRPEFQVTASRNTGAHDTKVYLYQEDLDRLESLAELTGVSTIATLIRAAVGWAYENMDA